MSDTRRHRGAHPSDSELFGASQHAPLRTASFELSWLIERRYALTSALKLVGDRHGLTQRQRDAVSRCAASESTVKSRQQRQIPLASCRELWIDGFNVLMTIEVALSQGVVLLARDGCYRDLASVHGTYRRVVETEPALTCLTHELRSVPRCRWLLDQPVSNSGKLATLIRAEAERCALDWSVELVPDPDQLLKQTSVPIASADSAVLDACGPWVNLARQVIDARVPTAWVVDLS